MRETMERLLARLIPVRPWLALASLLVGIAITVVAFWIHSLALAILGAPFLLGALAILLVPLPFPR